jgi:hypothetical protein
MRWWQYGLFGAMVLSLATAIKVIPTVVVCGVAGEGDWGEVAGFAAAIFGIGFLCRLIVWAGKGQYQKIGWAGDTIVGVAVMVAFFVCCMLLFEPEMLGVNFANGGAPMLGLAVVIGFISGPWFGRDIRRQWAITQEQ